MVLVVMALVTAIASIVFTCDASNQRHCIFVKSLDKKVEDVHKIIVVGTEGLIKSRYANY